MALHASQRGLQIVRRHARADGAAFFDRAMVNPENPEERMYCAEHQALAFAFVQAHRRCLLRWPTDTGKTIFLISYVLWRLGLDPKLSILFFGAAEEISKRPLRSIRNYIDPDKPDLNSKLRALFPHLVLSSDPRQPNTMTSVTVERPPGGIDPSVEALGIETASPGKKCKLIVFDDLLNRENTGTPAAREKLHKDFESLGMSRLSPHPESKAIFVNVPWADDGPGKYQSDLTFELERQQKWATLEMDIYGNIRLANTGWRSPMLRPSRLKPEHYRLAAHDPDPDEETPLFPERWGMKEINERRFGVGPNGEGKETASEFARSRLVKPRSSEETRCHREWFEGGIAPGIIPGEVHEYAGCAYVGRQRVRLSDEELGVLPVYVGSDMAWAEKKSAKNDFNALFAFGLIPIVAEGVVLRVLLRIESGQAWSGPTVVDKCKDIVERFAPRILMLETVGGQIFMKHFVARDLKHSVLVQGFKTTKDKKLSPEYGIEALFTEIERQIWRVPCNQDGTFEPEVQAWIDECVAYRPGAHPGDRLMASFFAWVAARRMIRELEAGLKLRSKGPPTEREALSGGKRQVGLNAAGFRPRSTGPGQRFWVRGRGAF